MSTEHIQTLYNEDLKPLEKLLSNVRRPGNFFISGSELYKLLIYDEGGFFLAHRDTEKSPGMFGTLVVVLPSLHRGGELVIRHAGCEVIIDLSRSEISKLAFAAFYADCEHEVRPITEGNRICLVYNLIRALLKRSSALKLDENMSFVLNNIRPILLR